MCSNEGPLLLFGKTSKRLFEGIKDCLCWGLCTRGVCNFLFMCTYLNLCVCVCYPFTVFLKKKKVTRAFVYLNWRR